ncbi:hypothetical protein NLX83_21560 [Allokutzneria sp. A3M-2-11 16]|uniref:phage tail protein n=1 Tax=Allokutzneria sp. A3M-2-11 16 TaxID=2962043 RepID=UPI0020B7E7BB|nr:hypothetical protein [Allokutzneria sp. A3M-2-11 16]MCP3801857.1 hypothetical protein [Allokutzneria sp. A3M-2-11 16]
MAGPGGREIGRVSVRVLPDTSAFGRGLQRYLDRTESRTRLQIGVGVDASAMAAEVRTAVTAATASAPEIALTPSVDRATLAAEVTTAARNAGGKVELAAAVNGTKATTETVALARRLGRTPVELPVELQRQRLAALRTEVRASLTRLTAEAKVQVRTELESTTGGRLALAVAALARRAAATIPLSVDLDRAKLGRAVSALGAMVTSLATVAGKGAALGGLVGALVAVASAAAQAGGAVALLPAVAGVALIAFTALKVGMAGFGEAMANIRDPAKFAESLAKLSPAARETALAVRSLVPAWDSLKLDVQDQLFRGLGGTVRELGSAYLPVLRTGLSDTAGALNAGAQNFAKFASSKQSVADLGHLFDNARGAVFNLGQAFTPVMAGLRDIAVVGSDFLPKLTAGAGAAAQRFADFASRARESGQMAQWISAALETLRTLREILGNVASAFGAVMRAGQETGGGLLQIIRDLTGQLAAFLNSAQGQEALKGVFAAVAEVARLVVPLLIDLARIIGTTVAPAIGQFVSTLAAGGGLQAALSAVGVALQALAPAFGPMGAALSALLAAVAPLIPPLAEIAGKLLTAIAEAIAKIDWTPLIDGVLAVFNALLPLLDPLVSLIKLGGELASAALPILGTALQVAADIIGFVVGIVVGAVTAFADFTSAIGRGVSFVSDKLAEFSAWGGRKIDEFVDFVADLPGKIGRFFADAGSWLLSAGADIINGLIKGVKDGAKWLYDSLKGIARGAIDTVKGWLGISSPSKEMAKLGRWTSEGFARGITDGIPLAARAAAALSDSALIAPPEATLPTAEGTGSGSGGVVINVYPAAGQSEESIAANVSRRLAFAGRFA